LNWTSYFFLQQIYGDEIFYDQLFFIQSTLLMELPHTECACDVNPLLWRELLKTIDRAATVMQLLSLIQTQDLLRLGLDSIPPWFRPRRIATLFARSYPSGKIKITGSAVPSFFDESGGKQSHLLTWISASLNFF
jgi:hypothetical protein